MLENVKMSAYAEDTFNLFFAMKRIPHAVIIEGTDSDNRMKAAHSLAAAVLCTADVVPCGECKSCVKIKKGVHPDVIVCDKEQNKATMGIDIIRRMKSDSVISANDSFGKVYIFKDAHTMTPQSQNALLKVFEEPPDHVSVILTCSSKEVLLDTVLSRGTLITLGEIDESSGGDAQTRKALEKTAAMCRILCRGNEFQFMKETGTFEKDKKLLPPVLESLSCAFSSAAVLKCGGKNISFDREIALMLSGKFTLAQLMSMTDKVNSLAESVRKNANNNLILTRLTSLLYNLNY